jgi:heme-degrading monooxygenase HmoA
MTGVLITFQYDEESFERRRIEGVAEGAKPTFVGLPGLRLKSFMIDEEARRAVNVYFWESEDDARAFFSDELRERVTGFYGVAPTIEFLEVMALVDNGVAPTAV